MLIEVVGIKGTSPSVSAFDYFKVKLHQNKVCELNNIRLLIREVDDPLFGMPWVRSRLTLLEQTQRKFPDGSPKDRSMQLFISYIPGPYLEPGCTNLAGLTYSDSSFSIMRSGCGSDIEGSTLLHEFGHILNLDFKGRKEVPVNENRPSHCNNKECVMYWQVTGPRKDFDNSCHRDLQKLIRDK